MSFETARIADIWMPDVCAERENRVSVGRGVIIRKHDTHFVEITEHRLARDGVALHSDYGFHPVPYLVLRRKSHSVFSPDDVRKGRLARIGAGRSPFGTKRIQFLPLFPKPRIASGKLLLVEIVDRFVHCLLIVYPAMGTDIK